MNADREVDPKHRHDDDQGHSSPTPGTSSGPGSTRRCAPTLELVKGALLVPQRAVTELQGGYRVAVVGADGKAEVRAVELGARVDDLWVIEKGVKPGEKVIVTGLQFVRPGMAVKVKPAPARARPSS